MTTLTPAVAQRETEERMPILTDIMRARIAQERAAIDAVLAEAMKPVAFPCADLPDEPSGAFDGTTQNWIERFRRKED